MNDIFKNIFNFFTWIFITVPPLSTLISSHIVGGGEHENAWLASPCHCPWHQWVLGALSPGTKWLEHEADSSAPLSFYLLNVAVSTPDYLVSNNRTFNQQWIGKDVEGIGDGLLAGTISLYALKALRKTMKTLNQDSQSPGWDFSHASLKYKPEPLTLKPWFRLYCKEMSSNMGQQSMAHMNRNNLTFLQEISVGNTDGYISQSANSKV
jgi:hypothetical protein